MIKSITITNHLGESIKLEPRFPEKSGFLFQDVPAGLGPPKADIRNTEMTTIDGSLLNSTHVTQRNIVFSFQLLPKPTVEITRMNSYKYFPISKRIKIKIETDSRICYTYGNVESNEPNIFTDKPSSVISVICNNSYLYSDATIITALSSVQPTFEFPFSNESLEFSTIQFGNIFLTPDESVVYNGDASIGMIITIHAIGPATNVRIINIETLEDMKINSTKLIALTGSDVEDGDDIIISTIKGDKYIRLLRNGEITNILNCLDKYPSWFQLAKGYNHFAFIADTGTENLQVKIENQEAYEGV